MNGSIPADFVLMGGDFFCGAGGGTTGLLAACKELGIKTRFVAVNHSPEAIATHKANHVDIEHFCENLESLWPLKAVPGGKLHIAIFAPECPHHSRARGAKPMNEQSRATAWCVVRWAELIDIENILVENVPEFADWGPLYPSDYGSDDNPADVKKRDRPIPERKGEYFREWKRVLKSRGYKVDHCVLNSAYFGAATSRPRFFLQAKKRGKITWPKPTHAPKVASQPSLFQDEKPFRGAQEIIDWSIPGESIFDRKVPLVENTMRRIFVGVEKFCGLPFLTPYFGEREGQQPCTRSVSDPMPVICGQQRYGLCRPYLVVLRNHADVVDLGSPMPTITAQARNHFYLAQAFLTQYFGGKSAVSLEQPIGTITANYEHYALTQPVLDRELESYLISYKGQDTVKDVELPLGTLTQKARFALLKPHLFSMEHTTIESGDSRRVFPINAPIPTVTARGAFGLSHPFILPPEGFYGGNRPRGLDEPMQTVTANRGGGHIVEPLLQGRRPFLVRYNGTGGAEPLEQPIPTLTQRDRFGLVHPVFLPVLSEQHGGNVEIVGVLDILYRMLKRHELSAAMGFPKNYYFFGNDTQVKLQIGNAIEVNMAKALCMEMLKPYAPKVKKSRARIAKEAPTQPAPVAVSAVAA